jgi:hypothetical protein
MIAAAALALWIAAAPPDNPIFRQLTEDGLVVDAAGKRRVALPKPDMADGLDAAAQRKVIDAVSGGRPYGDMVRDAIVAPLAMKIEDMPAQGGDPLRRVDAWYIVYGTLDQFFDERLAASLAELGRAEKTPGQGVLPDEALRRHNLEALVQDGFKEHFAHQAGVLFDRVQVSATRRIVATRADDSVLVAAVIDPRFNDDATYPNRWRSISIEGGRRTLGSPQPYVASGSYTKVTRLKEPAGALFVEHHYLFAEPHGWFRGAPLLRSKLPLAIQDNVRKLRRELRVGE